MATDRVGHGVLDTERLFGEHGFGVQVFDHKS